MNDSYVVVDFFLLLFLKFVNVRYLNVVFFCSILLNTDSKVSQFLKQIVVFYLKSLGFLVKKGANNYMDLYGTDLWMFERKYRFYIQKRSRKLSKFK